MNDNQIIDLFWSRDKMALEYAQQAYHSLLVHIAKNITSSDEDAEECANDTYLKLWETILEMRMDEWVRLENPILIDVKK